MKNNVKLAEDWEDRLELTQIFGRPWLSRVDPKCRGAPIVIVALL
jgi:hypothetical protein